MACQFLLTPFRCASTWRRCGGSGGSSQETAIDPLLPVELRSKQTLNVEVIGAARLVAQVRWTVRLCIFLISRLQLKWSSCCVCLEDAIRELVVALSGLFQDRSIFVSSELADIDGYGA